MDKLPRKDRKDATRTRAHALEACIQRRSPSQIPVTHSDDDDDQDDSKAGSPRTRNPQLQTRAAKQATGKPTDTYACAVDDRCPSTIDREAEPLSPGVVLGGLAGSVVVSCPDARRPTVSSFLEKHSLDTENHRHDRSVCPSRALL